VHLCGATRSSGDDRAKLLSEIANTRKIGRTGKCGTSDVVQPLHNILQINRLFLKKASMDALKCREQAAKPFDDVAPVAGEAR
jgi:hypothetical protein